MSKSKKSIDHTKVYAKLPGPQMMWAHERVLARIAQEERKPPARAPLPRYASDTRKRAPDTAGAQFYEGVIELCVYEDDQEEYVQRKDGRCFKLSRHAAKVLWKDLAAAIAEHDGLYAPRQDALL